MLRKFCLLAAMIFIATMLLGGRVLAQNDFNWDEVPQNEQVPIQRAVFTQSGYELYDTVGETIFVPFADNNLYVMKFGVSPDGSTYFINNGEPELFLPTSGYLENGTIPGAYWYPFSPDFAPESPVFLGIAPSWDAFISMGWYPGMQFYGGYWSSSGMDFIMSDGLVVVVGGQRYHGWNGYHRYWHDHPSFHRLGFSSGFHRFHEEIRRPGWSRPHSFRGSDAYHTGIRGNSRGIFTGLSGNRDSDHGDRLSVPSGHDDHGHNGLFSGIFGNHKTAGGSSPGFDPSRGSDHSFFGQVFGGNHPNSGHQGSFSFGGGQNNSRPSSTPSNNNRQQPTSSHSNDHDNKDNHHR